MNAQFVHNAAAFLGDANPEPFISASLNLFLCADRSSLPGRVGDHIVTGDRRVAGHLFNQVGCRANPRPVTDPTMIAKPCSALMTEFTANEGLGSRGRYCRQATN